MMNRRASSRSSARFPRPLHSGKSLCVADGIGATDVDETGFRSFSIQEEKRCIMSDGTKDPAGSPQQPADKSRADEAAISERLEKEADEMAGKAKKREEQYDEDHDIFTK